MMPYFGMFFGLLIAVSVILGDRYSSLVKGIFMGAAVLVFIVVARRFKKKPN